MAITHNSTSESAATSGVSSLTWSHTVASGSDIVMVVGTAARDATAGDRPVTSVVFNTSESLTKTREDVSGDNVATTGSWRRASPTVTTANIVVTFTGTVDTLAYAAAEVVNGADTANPIDAQNGATGNTSGAITVSLTTVTDGAWGIDMVFSSGNDSGSGNPPSNLTVDASQTQRQHSGAAGPSNDFGGMSTEEKATAGTLVMSWTAFWASGDRWVTSAVAIKPVTAAGSLIKTVNGLAIASVKTKNGLAIASVKSINGLTNV